MSCGGKKEKILESASTLTNKLKNFILNDILNEDSSDNSDADSEEFLDVSICDSDCSDCFEYQKQLNT